MKELEDEILDMAHRLRDKISELTDMDDFDYSHINSYQNLGNSISDFIGDH